MRRWLIILFLFLVQQAVCQPLYEHRGVQYATHGTDFWFGLPRDHNGISEDHACMYVIAEHDCTVTIRNDLLGYVQTKNITGSTEINSRLDTLNFIELPKNIIYGIEYLSSNIPVGNQQPAYGPQPRAFHLTSTDTITAFIFSYSNGNIDVTNLLPTEMLRDEYVVRKLIVRNNYPKERWADYGLQDKR